MGGGKKKHLHHSLFRLCESQQREKENFNVTGFKMSEHYQGLFLGGFLGVDLSAFIKNKIKR